MSSVRKLVSGKWQVAIRRKDQPVIYKTFKDKGLASKFGKDVEARMERNIFEDYSGASATTLKDLICKYLVEEGIDCCFSKNRVLKKFRTNSIQNMKVDLSVVL